MVELTKDQKPLIQQIEEVTLYARCTAYVENGQIKNETGCSQDGVIDAFYRREDELDVENISLVAPINGIVCLFRRDGQLPDGPCNSCQSGRAPRLPTVPQPQVDTPRT